MTTITPDHVDSRVAGRPRIVVIDDSATCRKIISRCLEPHGFDVAEVADSRQALETAKSLEPILVITDLNMPHMDGYAVCRAIKSDPETSQIPVIFVTSEEGTDQIVRGFEAGGADYVTKSADGMEIVARVRTHVHIAQLQNELRQSRDTLARQLREIEERDLRERELHQRIENQQSQMLQNEKMASIGQLAAGVAHEINNPIGFVSSNLYSLMRYLPDIKAALEADQMLIDAVFSDHPDAAEKARHAAACRKRSDLDETLADLDDLVGESIEGTERVRKIVADLRDFSHVDSSDLADEDINVLLEKTISVAWNELKYKAQVVREFGDVPMVSCYGGKLAQVFLNLLVNAAHAFDQHGTITVRTMALGDQVAIEVQDTGRGIAPEHIGSIFDPFFTTKEVGKGTGLGLHLAFKIVRAHEGDIHVASELGRGTTFRVELPVKGPAKPKEQVDGQAA